MNEYNLLDEKWIPVLYHDGTVDRVGILKALEDAGRIRQIAASNPMDRVAVLRFLLAILYWCKGNPDSPRDSSLSSDRFAKLRENSDCFNLLGDGKRFYQYGGTGDKLSANYLVQEIPTGTNMRHFRHSTDKRDGLCPACCALGLLRLPLFATSGGRGKPPGVNAKPPIYAIPVGDSLEETLLLSWRNTDSLGEPFWEQPSSRLPKSIPLLTGLTWVPRRVWLDDPSEPAAACKSCGRVDRLIRLSVFAAIGSQKTDDGEQAGTWRDPHVIYEQNGKSLHNSDPLGASDAAAGQWAKTLSGVIEGEPTAPKVWIVGFATVQNDKYLEAIERTVPMFPFADVENIRDLLGQWQKEARKLSSRLKPPGSKSSSRKHLEIPPLVNAVRPHVEGRVSADIESLLTGGEEEWQAASEEYAPMMSAVARSLAPGFTTAAVRRRRQVETTLPNIRRKSAGGRKEAEK